MLDDTVHTRKIRGGGVVTWRGPGNPFTTTPPDRYRVLTTFILTWESNGSAFDRKTRRYFRRAPHREWERLWDTPESFLALNQAVDQARKSGNRAWSYAARVSYSKGLEDLDVELGGDMFSGF